mmetsp:Transcript_33664/g.108735  ORF Transcript_33664/g.108735 Transcript_33664/m.108735 type:complete len:244 (-) Transcript_33664:385-1116(-)
MPLKDVTPLIKPAVRCALPDLSHLHCEDFEAVYEPSDDTFLLLDALASDVACLRGQLPGVCLELGSGSGAVITGLSQILSRAGVPGSAAALMATDLNPAANAASARTAAANGASVQVLNMDLLHALRPGVIDVLVFNPPYVPTSLEEAVQGQSSADLYAAWAGGPKGRVVLDRLLPTIGALLSPSGVFYLLGVRDNDPDDLARYFEAHFHMHPVIIAERRAQNERLFVMRVSRAPQPPPLLSS